MQDHSRLMRLILTTAYSDTKLGHLHGCSRSSVTRYRLLCHDQHLTPEDIDRLGESGVRGLVDSRTATGASRFVQPDWHEVAMKLRRRFTLLDLHGMYTEQSGSEAAMSYREFCRRARAFICVSDPIMRQTHFAGEKTMLDFAGYEPKVRLAPEAKPIKAQMFLAVLPASDYTFALIVPSQKSRDWIAANEAALRFFGGASELQVLDNLKAGVILHRRGEEPKINAIYQAFCDHYGTKPWPTKPRSPTHKAKVEIAVKLVQRLYRFAFHNGPVPTLAEANLRLAKLVAAVNAKQLRRLPGQTRRSLFEALDLPLLRPLRTEPFVLTEVRQHLKVPREYHVIHEHRSYSVSHRLIGQLVDLKISHAVIEILHDGRCVATHPRLAIVGARSTDPTHMPDNHLAQAIVSAPDLRQWSLGYGPAVVEAAERIAGSGLSGAALAATSRSMKTLGLRVGPARLEAACRFAIALGDVTAARLRSTLNRGLEYTDPLEAPPTHVPLGNDNVRGATYFEGL